MEDDNPDLEELLWKETKLELGEEEKKSDYIARINIAFVNEKNAPELLPYDGELMDSLKEMINDVQSQIEEGELDQLEVLLHEMDVERVKFALTSYLRARLAKIQKFNIHSLQELESYMSAQECKFAASYYKTRLGFFRENVLNRLPNEFQDIKEVEMITKPNLNQFVIARILTNLGIVQSDEVGAETQVLNEGSIVAIKYDTIRTYLKNGTVCLM